MEAKNATTQQVEYKSNVKQKIDLFTSVAGGKKDCFQWHLTLFSISVHLNPLHS